MNTFFIITLTCAVLPAVVHAQCTALYYNISDRTPPSTVVYRAQPGYTVLPISDQTQKNSFAMHFNVFVNGSIAVSSTVPLDRNAMALDLGYSILPVRYTLTYYRDAGCISLTLYIMGLDNKVPTFPRNAVNLSIVEGDGKPSSWPMDLATDLDEGINSTQNYYIDNSSINATFYLDMTRDTSGAITILQLRRRVAIDREVTPSFSFNIVAEEGRPSAPKGFQHVYINVEDLCDFVPMFPITAYSLELPENTSINSAVLALRAIDLDSNSHLTYAISSQCAKSNLISPCQSNTMYPADGSVPFFLNSTTGNLVLIQKLEYEKAQEIFLVVTATDNCNLVGTAQIRVTVLYVDDNPPNIDIILVNNGAIREDYTLSSDVATVTITSPVSFNVSVIDNTTGLTSNTFSLYNLGSSYRLRLLRLLDSRVQSSYNVTIKAIDAGKNIAYSTVTINIIPVNHAPVFSIKTVTISIPTNIRNGTAVLRVHASDRDIGSYGVVTYEIPPPNAMHPYQNIFTVSTSGGVVIVNGNLGNSIVNTFLLLIKARDNPTDGVPYLSDYMVVNVTLVDPNVYRPIFPSQQTQINVTDNVMVGTTIFQVLSHNPSTVLNNIAITYSLASSFIFVIESASGIISVAGLLDYSTTKQYVLSILANNGISDSSIFNLTINILPGDAVGPVFFPSVYSVQVVRRAAVGTRVVDVKAVDTYSSALLYQIVDGNGEGKFTINPTNGTITILNPLEQAGTQNYTLMVKASDEKYYSKRIAQVTISLLNFEFSNLLYQFQVQEGLFRGTVVGTMLTSLSNTGRVYFTILSYSPNDAFEINSTSGTITTKKALSITTAAYTLIIAATYYPLDRSALPTSIQQMVSISILKQLGKPQFNQPEYVASILKSMELGTVVLNVTATDTTNGAITYSLRSSSPVPFTVDSTTGSIYVAAYLDTAPKYTYTFDVQASGHSGQSAVTVTLHVSIQIAFDSQLQHNVVVSATATKGSVVTTIRATGRRGIPIYYYFSNDEPKKYFQINKFSGDVTLLVDPTTTVVQRQSNSIDALILAQDSQDPSINSTISISLTLKSSLMSSAQNPTSDLPLMKIVGAAGGSMVIIAAVFVIVVIAVVLSRRRTASKPHNAEGVHSINCGSNRNSAILTSFEPPHPDHQSQTGHETISADPITSSRNQQALSKDDISKGEPVYRTSSSRTVPHARSTSDLASTVGTELLSSGVEDIGPYTMAQLTAIYTANAQLLVGGGSQDSVHMFGSEGGVEVDEVDHMILGKAMEFEEGEEDDTSVMDDTSVHCAEMTQKKGRRTPGKGLWLPSSIGSQSDDAPRYDSNHSQSSGTNSLAYDDGRESYTFHSRHSHDSHAKRTQGYYNEMEHQWNARYRLPNNESSFHNLNSSLPSAYQTKTMYSSTLEKGSMSTHRHMKYSPELTCPDGSLPPLGLLHHTPLSDTQTDDGNHANSSTHQEAGPGYYYASSTSIASTNLS